MSEATTLVEPVSIAPVALFLFNRPLTTAKVFAKIREAKPAALYLIADGPRANRPDEGALCERARAAVADVDWPCEVHRHYSQVNLGCRQRLITGMQWLFEQTEAAIILEDDCLPSSTFFRFCTDMLERYRDDRRVMSISGSNLQRGARRNADSYYFSQWVLVWGWATWRRAWNHYEPTLARWPVMRDQGWLSDYLQDPDQVRHWTAILDDMQRHQRNTWDYQWVFAVWAQGGLSVMPAVNQIENIGFGPDATHTTALESPVHEPARELEFPLRHPEFCVPDRQADRRTFLRATAPRSLRGHVSQRLIRLKRLLRSG